jgi:hypothetical protein
LNDGDGGRQTGAGCLAAAWFDVVLLSGAFLLTWPVVSLAALGCPSGGPGCGVGLALLSLFGWAGGIAVAFTAVVLGLAWLARRWLIAVLALGALGLVLLAIPSAALARALLVGDTWLTFAILAVWLVVPGISILADVHAERVRRQGT